MANKQNILLNLLYKQKDQVNGDRWSINEVKARRGVLTGNKTCSPHIG